MAQTYLVNQMADAVAAIRYEALPPGLAGKVKLCLLDALECAFARPVDPRKAGALASVPKAGTPSPGSVRLFGTCAWAAAADAAFVNSVYISSSPRIDIDRQSGCHPGSIVLPTALAVAESEGCSGQRFIEGAVAGYETMIRLGLAFQCVKIPSAFRPTALYAPLGAAFAAAKTASLPADTMAAAVSLACHSASGFNEWSASGTGEDAFHSGWGARHGVQAMQLARADVPACRSILEGPNGFLAAFGAQAGAPQLLEGLGEEYLLFQVQHKPMDACLMLQGPCQIAAALAQAPGFDWRKIDTVTITVSRQAQQAPGCDNATHVTMPSHATQSIQYGMAATLVGGSCAGINWLPPYDPDVLALMGRCRLEVDDAYTRVFPQQTASRVRITMQDGSVLAQEAGDFRSLTEAEVTARFRATLGRVFGPERTRQIYDTVQALDTLPDITALTSLLAL